MTKKEKNNLRNEAIKNYFIEKVGGEIRFKQDVVYKENYTKKEDRTRFEGKVYVPCFEEHVSYDMEIINNQASITLQTKPRPLTNEIVVEINLFNSMGDYKAYYVHSNLFIKSNNIILSKGLECEDLFNTFNKMINDELVLSVMNSHMRKIVCPNCGEELTYAMVLKRIEGDTITAVDYKYVCTKCENQYDVNKVTDIGEYINFFAYMFASDDKEES